MKTINHFIGTCQDHASHLDLTDLLILATVVVAVKLYKNFRHA